jgi:hypothetical protein
MSTPHQPNRTPSGVPTGGQFATSARTEADVTLAPSPKQWRASTVDAAFAELTGTGARDERPRVDVKKSVAAMRADLRTLYGPGMSVRMAGGTAYGWARIDWEDGPRTGPVQAIADGFCDERFDGMTDSYRPVNTDAPVHYSLSGVNTQRHIGPAGQRHIDAIFDRAGLTGYQRAAHDGAGREPYDGGYDWATTLSEGAVERVERVLHQPLPARHLLTQGATASQLAHAIHTCTDYTGDTPRVDTSPY